MIGVWDPSDALEFTNNNGIQKQNETAGGATLPKNGLKLNPVRDEEISELIAIGNNTTIHNYADMSDDDDDAAEYDNFKFLMDNKITGKLQ